MNNMILRTDFESKYFSLIGKVADIHEFLMYADEKNEIVSDALIMLKNIIEASEENYINYKEETCTIC
jgi:hypothetical protein